MWIPSFFSLFQRAFVSWPLGAIDPKSCISRFYFTVLPFLSVPLWFRISSLLQCRGNTSVAFARVVLDFQHPFLCDAKLRAQFVERTWFTSRYLYIFGEIEKEEKMKIESKKSFDSYSRAIVFLFRRPTREKTRR